MAASLDFTTQSVGYSDVTNGPSAATLDDFTLSGWFYIENSPNNNPVLLSFGDSSQTNIDSIWITALNSGLLRFKLNDGTNTTIDVSGWTANEWVHVVATTASGNDHKLYKNGAQIGSSSTSKTYGTTHDRWVIGRFAGNSDFSQIYDGKAAYIGFYDRALSAEEVKEIFYKPYSICDGLVWAPDSFTESISGPSSIKDMSGLGYTCNIMDTISNSLLGPPVQFY